MNWIKGQPDKPGTYWVYFDNYVRLIDVCKNYNELYACYTNGSSYFLLKNLCITHYIPTERPEPPMPDITILRKATS